MAADRYRFTFVAWKHDTHALGVRAKPLGEAWTIISYPGAVVATSPTLEAAEKKLRATLECYFKFAGSIGAWYETALREIPPAGKTEIADAFTSSASALKSTGEYDVLLKRSNKPMRLPELVR